MRRREFIALLAGAAAIRPLGADAERPQERILYFAYSAGYRHDVIPLSKTILTQLGKNSGVFEYFHGRHIRILDRKPQELRRGHVLHNRRTSDERR